jgi:hypothetical protein
MTDYSMLQRASVAESSIRIPFSNKTHVGLPATMGDNCPSPTVTFHLSLKPAATPSRWGPRHWGGGGEGEGRQETGCGAYGMRLPSQDDIDSREKQFQFSVRDLSHALREKISVESDDLGDVGHRILGKTRETRRKRNVSGRARPSEIAG